MKKFALAVTAASLLVGAMSTPAFALVDTTYGTNPSLDAACDALLNPSDQSNFSTYALNVTTSTSTSTVDVGPTFIVPLGSPTTVMSGIYAGSEHLNGGSPNIFGNADISVVYNQGAEIRVNTLTTVTTTTSGTGCHVHKMVGMNDDIHSGFTAPPGLQITTPVSTKTEVTTPGVRVVDTIPGPYTDPTQSQKGAETVICISPSTTVKKGNPGSWVSKNGYTGTCSTTLYNSLVGKFYDFNLLINTPPTNSLPAS